MKERSDEELEHMARTAGLLDIIDDAYLARGDWLPEAREFAGLVAAETREECAKVCDGMAACDLVEGLESRYMSRAYESAAQAIRGMS